MSKGQKRKLALVPVEDVCTAEVVRTTAEFPAVDPVERMPDGRLIRKIVLNKTNPPKYPFGAVLSRTQLSRMLDHNQDFFYDVGREPQSNWVLGLAPLGLVILLLIPLLWNQLKILLGYP